MMVSCAEARSKVERLVERFARHLDAYRRAGYKEAQVRTEFIDPLFEALGWDVRNVHGYAEQYKDVVHEDAIPHLRPISRALRRRLRHIRQRVGVFFGQ